MRFCATHRYQRATHECDGCGVALCAACYEEGHKLLFCRHCGERAVPIVAAEAIPGTPEARAASYGLAEALAYPFRGLGLYLFLAYVGLLFLFDLLASFSLVAGLALMAPRLLIAASLPGLLFAIVRSTAAGNDELPDWPDWSDVGRVAGDVLGFVLAIVVSIAPLLAFVFVVGCYDTALCWLGLALSIFLGSLLWVPAFGVVGVYESATAALRIDLHLALLARLGGPVAAVALAIAGLSVAGTILQLIVGLAPLVGALSATAIGAYTLFLAPHLVGLLFRRHRAVTEAVYG